MASIVLKWQHCIKSITGNFLTYSFGVRLEFLRHFMAVCCEKVMLREYNVSLFGALVSANQSTIKAKESAVEVPQHLGR